MQRKTLSTRKSLYPRTPYGGVKKRKVFSILQKKNPKNITPKTTPNYKLTDTSKKMKYNKRFLLSFLIELSVVSIELRDSIVRWKSTKKASNLRKITRSIGFMANTISQIDAMSVPIPNLVFNWNHKVATPQRIEADIKLTRNELLYQDNIPNRLGMGLEENLNIPFWVLNFAKKTGVPLHLSPFNATLFSHVHTWLRHHTSQRVRNYLENSPFQRYNNARM